MLVLIQLKPKCSFQGFISTSYIGEVEEYRPRAPTYTLKRVCTLYEVLSQNPAVKGFDINTRYYTNFIASNGPITFSGSDVLFSRIVEPGDEILKGYEDAHAALRLSKINIQQASVTPNVSPILDLGGRPQ